MRGGGEEEGSQLQCCSNAESNVLSCHRADESQSACFALHVHSIYLSCSFLSPLLMQHE